MKPYLIFLIIVLITFSSVHAATQVEITNIETIEETDSSFVWSAGWSAEQNSMASEGTWKTSNTSGAEVNITFEGVGISLFYVRGPGAPIARLYIDGMYLDDLNASSDTQVGTVKRIVAQDLSSGNHVLTLVISEPGAKNPFVIDGVEVTSKAVSPGTGSSAYLIIILVVAVIASVLYISKEKIKKKPKEPEVEIKPEKPKKIEKTQRIEDLMKTMDEKDRAIVDYLIEQNGESKQSAIRYALQMPRSTLSKRIAALERKNIITLKKFGKTNIVELTPWFTSGEEKERL